MVESIKVLDNDDCVIGILFPVSPGTFATNLSMMYFLINFAFLVFGVMSLMSPLLFLFYVGEQIMSDQSSH